MITVKNIHGIIILVSFFSCNHRKNILSGIEEVIGLNPDSASYLLADIDTSKVNVSEINYFRLLEVMAKDKSDRDISDNQIHDLTKYYESVGDFDKAALSSFYSGKIYQQNSDYKEALKSYYYTQLLEDNLSDQEIIGKSIINAGYIIFNQKIYSEAINDLRKSLAYIPTSSRYYPSVFLFSIYRE